MVPLVAVDVPSGVGVDTGQLDGAHVTADVTVTFGTHKVAHLVDPAAVACGALHLVDLDLQLGDPAVEALQPADVRRLLPRPATQAHKYTRGVIGVRAGSDTYPGAALLAVSGANCGLAGMVRYVGPAHLAEQVRIAHPEVVGAGRVQAWVVGPGGGDDAASMLADARHGRRTRRRRRRRAGPRRLPAAGLCPHAPRRRARRAARHRARAGRGRSAALGATGGRCVRRRGAAQGPPHARRRSLGTRAGDHHRGAVAGERRGRRRAVRAGRRAAGCGARPLRRSLGRLVAAWGSRHAGLRGWAPHRRRRGIPHPAPGARDPHRFGDSDA